MWERVEKDGVVYYTATPFENVSLYQSTRLGGVSVGNFESLNLLGGKGDKDECVRENWKRFLSATQLEGDFVFLHQVHSAQVYLASLGISGRAGDGLVSCDEGLIIGVFTADCLPVFFASPCAVGIAHAGRRGVLAGVVENLLKKLLAIGASKDEIVVYFGPCIRECCYEVGEEVVGAKGFYHRDGKVFFDIPGYVKGVLQGHGVTRIIDPGWCTFCNAKDEFFSYRRGQGVTGQQVSLIGVRRQT